jgi:hypothetical protein
MCDISGAHRHEYHWLVTLVGHTSSVSLAGNINGAHRHAYHWLITTINHEELPLVTVERDICPVCVAAEGVAISASTQIKQLVS